MARWPDAPKLTLPTAPSRAVEGESQSDDATPSPLGDSVSGGLGLVALPRRVVRFLAAGARPTLIATTLGILLRCVARRRAGWSARGRVKASWIAEVFAVDARRVKAARAELIQLGWLRADDAKDPQWAWNRWGRAYHVNLAWTAPSRPRPATSASPTPSADCHPAPPLASTELPPPDLHPDPVPEKKDPDPGFARPTGVELAQVSEDVYPATQPQKLSSENNVGSASQKASKAPAWQNLETGDLVDLDRTLTLYAAAVRAGWLSGGEADRLHCVAAAMHARAVGTTNPPGLFRAIVQGRRWHLLTQKDEDRARAGLRLFDRTGATAPTPLPGQTRHQPTAPTAPRPLRALMDRFAPTLARLGANYPDTGRLAP